MTQKEKILNLLGDGEWHHFAELNKIAFRYGAVLCEMKKKEGIDHEIKKVGRVRYYRLIPRTDSSIREEMAKQEPERRFEPKKQSALF